MSTRWNSVEHVLKAMAALPEFLQGPPNVGEKGIFGNTPLKVAAVWGDPDAIHLLLDAGADIDARNEHGFTALHHAAQQGHIAAAKALIQRGANLALLDDEGRTPAQCCLGLEIADFFKREVKANVRRAR